MGPLVGLVGTGRVISGGSVERLVGSALFLRLGDAPSYAALMLPTIVPLGIGFALMFPSLNIQAVAGGADHEQGLASGLLNTSLQVGGAVGLAVVTAVVSGGTGGVPSVGEFQSAIVVSLGLAVMAVLVAL